MKELGIPMRMVNTSANNTETKLSEEEIAKKYDELLERMDNPEPLTEEQKKEYAKRNVEELFKKNEGRFVSTPVEKFLSQDQKPYIYEGYTISCLKIYNEDIEKQLLTKKIEEALVKELKDTQVKVELKMEEKIHTEGYYHSDAHHYYGPSQFIETERYTMTTYFFKITLS